MIPCTSDPCQEKTMRKIQAAVEEVVFQRRLADHLSGLFADPSRLKGKKFGEEEQEQWHMTGLGKYQKGLELEAEGLSAAEVASRLGFSTTQAWWASKAYYAKKQAAFNARAKGEPIAESPHLVEADHFANADKTMPDKTHNENSPKPISGLKIETQITAEGKALRYRLNSTQLLINRHNANHSTLTLSIEEAMTMLKELLELMKP